MIINVKEIIELTINTIIKIHALIQYKAIYTVK